MNRLIPIRDERVLEAHLDGDEPHIRRARRCAGESRRRALGPMAGGMVGDPDDEME